MDKIGLLHKMVSGNPTDSNAWYLLGLEYAQQKNIGEAIRAYSEALKYCDGTMKNDIINALSSLSTISGVDKVTEQQDDPAFQDYFEEKYATEENEGAGEIEDAEEIEAETGKLIPLRVVGGKNSGRIPLDEDRKSTVTFADVGGLHELKDTIRMKIIKPFSTPGLFKRFKKKTGGGILLYGPPGCGKTFIAKATAGECQAKFIPVHITDILDPYLGVSSQNIKDVFAKARTEKPCILFFDEIDTLGFNRAKLTGEHMRPIIDQLLVEIEGVESDNEKMLIVGATNMPWDVDPALRRPGRFDKLIFVSPPDAAARKEIFMLKMKDRPAENIDYSVLAKKSELYSGADIENVVELAAENVIESIIRTGTERKITTKDLLAAIDKTTPSTIDWLKTIQIFIKYGSNSAMFSDVAAYLKKYRDYIGG